MKVCQVIEMRTLAIIQARMASTRLPGKVLRNLCGQPVLYHIIQRVKRMEHIDNVIVATSEHETDEPVFEFARGQGIDCFRGSEGDVLERFAQAAQAFDAKPEDVIMRLTADNPFVDPGVCGELLSYFDKHSFSYAATAGYPLGIGAEVFTGQALQEAHKNARKAYEREHVTPFLYRPGQVYGTLRSAVDLSHVRLTIDTPEDYQAAQNIYDALYGKDPNFGFLEIMDYLDNNPEVAAMNQHVHQKQLGE